ncbi:NAD(P)-dependent oxidoreductase [Maribacter confluentis]|uniref:NAD(P)-dependent oxidoreductase n=1 Tax=Maribacter confluentis TaxID=1656093 RepID=A0ABT8RUJ4_9FLAO|nr:NAD(P)-dependent oxidoreductase [Maribacter confluentis]MDO1514303.1 NAD(P)-dependent oxidoreductase [Maribacter confluentis]
MNVLLTGATGFLGANILHHFTNMGHHVETIGRSQENDIIADLATFNKPLNTKYDLVIHAAGKAHVIPKTHAEEKLFYDVNLEGTKNLLKNLVMPPKNLIFISTVAVYGLDHGQGIDEDYPLKATTPYGKSKVMAENEILAWAKINEVGATILRLPLIIGRNPKGNLKSMIHGIQKGFYFNIGKGNAKKSMVLVDDISMALPILMKQPNIYHLTDGHDPSFKELSGVIAKEYGLKKIYAIPYYVIKPIALCGDIIKKLFSISPPIDSLKLDKINKSLTFNDSKARTAGYSSRQILDNKEYWLN